MRSGRKNPYVGARPLEEYEQLFGREREVEELVSLLRSERIVLLHSPSGAGKSSLINARVVPRLKEERFDTPRSVRVGGAELIPGHPSGRFVGNLLANLKPPEMAIADLRALDTCKAIKFVSKSLHQGNAPFPVLIFDQFEDVVTTERTNAAAIEELFDRLGTLLENRNIWALFAMREDYLGAIEPFLHYIPGAMRRRLRLDLLTHDEAVQAIHGPVPDNGPPPHYAKGAPEELARRLRLRRDPRHDGLVEGLYVEPVLLQVVCTDIWEHLEDDATIITIKDLPDETRVSEALAHFYERVVSRAATASVSVQAIRSWVSSQLIVDGLRVQTREGPTRTAADGDVLDNLVDAYLIRRDVRNDVVWYELVHDRLVAGVEESDRQQLRSLPAELRVLRPSAQAWADQRRNPFLLLRGAALSNVLARYPDPSHLSPLEQEYLEASLMESRRRRVERWLTAIAALAILLGLGAGYFGWRQQVEAKMAVAASEVQVKSAVDAAARIAVESRRTVENARINAGRAVAAAKAEAARLDVDARTARAAAEAERRQADAYLLAVESTRAEAAKSLDAAERHRAELSGQITDARTALAAQAAELATAETRITLRDTAVTAVHGLTEAPREGARQVIDAARDALKRSDAIDTYALRNIPTLLQASNHLATISHEDSGGGIALTAVDGTGAGAGKTLHVITTSGRQLTVPIPAAPAASAAMKATDCRQHYLCVDADGKGEPVVKGCDVPPPCASPLRPISVALADKAGTTAVGYYTGAVVVVPAAASVAVPGSTPPPDRVVPVRTHKHPAIHLALRDDGKELASASALWSFAVSRAVDPVGRIFRKPSLFRWFQIVFQGGTSEMISSVGYLHTRDRLLAIGFEDGRLELWDVLARHAVYRVHAHSGAVLSLASNHKGTEIMTASSDGMARTWSIKETLTDEDLPSRRRVMRTLDEPQRNLGPHGGAVTAAAFSPDGTLAVTAGADSQLRVWDLRDSRILAKFPGHRSRVRAVRFVRSDLLASTSEDGTTRLWRMLTAPRLRELREVSEQMEAQTAALAGDRGDQYVGVAETTKEQLLGLLDRADALTR